MRRRLGDKRRARRWPGALAACLLVLLVTPGASGAAVRLHLLTVAQRGAVGLGVLRLSVRAPAGSRLRLSARARRTGRHASSRSPGAIVRGATVRLGGHGSTTRTVLLRLTPTGRRVLSRCVTVRVIVSARVLRGHGRSSRAFVAASRILALDPARCPSAGRQLAGLAGEPGVGLPTTPPVGAHGERTLVGAATRSITPPDPEYATHVGGYGDCAGCDKSGGTTEVNPGDDLRARAVVIRRGAHAEVMATADLEGWFAGYKQGPGLGLNDLRQQVASELSRPVSQGGQGLAMGPQDIIVSSVHCHACPTVVGIWGKTNVRYLKFVYDQMRIAIEQAAAQARPAALQWATADLGYVNGVVLGLANANEGWPIDGQLSILRATDAATGQAIATYANVPAHGNIVHGPDSHKMSSEYFGAADRWLEAHTGGVGVVGPGTLGDQTTPMQGTDSSQALEVDSRLGALVGSTVADALARHAHTITDPTLAGAEQYLVLPFTNPALSGSDCQASITKVVGIEIDRSCDPPYAINVAGLGVWFTTLRIGTIAVASEPGEAFPHVTFAVRRVISGAQAVFTPGQAQDQLGYYYEPFAFPTTFVYSADHNIFHASQALAEANAQVQVANATKLGFAVTPSAIDPTGNDFTRLAHQGIQVWAYPPPLRAGLGSGPGDTETVSVYRAPARCSAAPGALCSSDPGPAIVDFGDGSPKLTVSSRPGRFDCCIDTTHTFPHPGDYDVRATLASGETWLSTVHVRSPWLVTNTAHYPQAQTVFSSPGQSGSGASSG